MFNLLIFDLLDQRHYNIDKFYTSICFIQKNEENKASLYFHSLIILLLGFSYERAPGALMS